MGEPLDQAAIEANVYRTMRQQRAYQIAHWRALPPEWAKFANAVRFSFERLGLYMYFGVNFDEDTGEVGDVCFGPMQAGMMHINGSLSVSPDGTYSYYIEIADKRFSSDATPCGEVEPDLAAAVSALTPAPPNGRSGRAMPTGAEG